MLPEKDININISTFQKMCGIIRRTLGENTNYTAKI
jgi:hypothetical protein